MFFTTHASTGSYVGTSSVETRRRWSVQIAEHQGYARQYFHILVATMHVVYSTGWSDFVKNKTQQVRREEGPHAKQRRLPSRPNITL